MLIEVYSGEKPAIGRRAWLAAIVLFALVAGLAAQMTWRKSQAGLAPRITPPGWSVSFCPPEHFPESEFGPTVLGPAFRFRGRSTGGTIAQLVVFRVDGWGAQDALEVCAMVLNAFSSGSLLHSMSTRVTRLDRKLGPLDAVEVTDSEAGVVVRAAVLDSGEAYAVLLGVDGPPVDARAYREYELTCDSVRYHGR